MMRNIFLTVILCVVVSLTNLYAAVSSEDQSRFIQMYSSIAVQEMYRSGIPASITLAQAILESGWGKAPLALNSNNYFGIKCKDEWNGARYYHEDDDYVNGIKVKSCFRVYNDIEASFRDHTDFIANRHYYEKCFLHDSDKYVEWAISLKAGGYATAENYAVDLIELIEKYDLHQFDVKGYNTTLSQSANATTYYNPEKMVVRHQRPTNTPIVQPRRAANNPPEYSVPNYTVSDSAVVGQMSIPAPPPTQRIGDNYIPKWQQGTSMKAKAGTDKTKTPNLQSSVLPSYTKRKTVPQGKKSEGTYKRHTRNIQYRPSASSTKRR